MGFEARRLETARLAKANETETSISGICRGVMQALESQPDLDRDDKKKYSDFFSKIEDSAIERDGTSYDHATALRAGLSELNSKDALPPAILASFIEKLNKISPEIPPEIPHDESIKLDNARKNARDKVSQFLAVFDEAVKINPELTNNVNDPISKLRNFAENGRPTRPNGGFDETRDAMIAVAAAVGGKDSKVGSKLNDIRKNSEPDFKTYKEADKEARERVTDYPHFREVGNQGKHLIYVDPENQSATAARAGGIGFRRWERATEAAINQVIDMVGKDGKIQLDPPPNQSGALKSSIWQMEELSDIVNHFREARRVTNGVNQIFKAGCDANDEVKSIMQGSPSTFSMLSKKQQDSIIKSQQEYNEGRGLRENAVNKPAVGTSVESKAPDAGVTAKVEPTEKAGLKISAPATPPASPRMGK